MQTIFRSAATLCQGVLQIEIIIVRYITAASCLLALFSKNCYDVARGPLWRYNGVAVALLRYPSALFRP